MFYYSITKRHDDTLDITISIEDRENELSQNGFLAIGRFNWLALESDFLPIRSNRWDRASFQVFELYNPSHKDFSTALDFLLLTKKYLQTAGDLYYSGDVIDWLKTFATRKCDKCSNHDPDTLQTFKSEHAICWVCGSMSD